jgi:hypothetical protein
MDPETHDELRRLARLLADDLAAHLRRLEELAPDTAEVPTITTREG